MLANWISETTATTGTGTISLGGAASADLRPMSSGYASGDYVPYLIKDGNNRESGIGLLTSGSPWTLARTIIEEKWESGSYTAGPATGLDLSGSAVVSTGVSSKFLPPSLKPHVDVASTVVYRYPPNLVVPASDIPYNISAGSAGGQYFETANMMMLIGIHVPQMHIITALSLICTTAVAGAAARLGIYSANPVTGLPDDLLCDSGELSLAATGMIGSDLGAPLVLTPGLYYLADIGNNTTARCRGTECQSVDMPICNVSGYQRKFGYAHTFGALPQTITPASLTLRAGYASYGQFWK